MRIIKLMFNNSVREEVNDKLDLLIRLEWWTFTFQNDTHTTVVGESF